MGWRKLTIQDGDLARCSDLSATEQVRRSPTLWTINCGSILERLASVGPDQAQWSGPWTCSNCSLLVQ